MENKTYKELLKANERLDKELAEKEDECAKKGLKWEEMLAETKDIRIQIAENDRKARNMKDPTMQFGKKWAGDLMTLEDFVNSVENGFFVDNDGYGRYATETGVSDIHIYPSDVLDNEYRHDFSHVMWFNK